MRNATISPAALLAALVALLGGALGGCEEHVVDPRILWIESNYTGTITLARLIHHAGAGTRSRDSVGASFQDHDGGGLFAGDVLVGAMPLRLDSTVVDGYLVQSYSATDVRDGFSIPFGGESIGVRVGGSPRIPAFEDSVASLADELAIDAPASGEVIAKRGDIVVEWSATSDRRTRVDVTLERLASVDGAPVARRRMIAEGIADDGALTIAADSLAALSIGPGPYRLCVTRVVNRPVTVKGNRRVLLAAICRATVDIVIAE